MAITFNTNKWFDELLKKLDDESYKLFKIWMDRRRKRLLDRKNRYMIQLTTEMTKMWKAGRWKYSYTNLNLSDKTKGFLAVSGRYFYLIDFTGLPQVVSFKSVPKTYKKYVNPNKIIYRYPSKLTKIEKREGMR